MSKVASLAPSKHTQQSNTTMNNSSNGATMVQQQSGIPSSSPGSPLAPGTGIPKPTAAVKGTAKSTPPTSNLNHHHSTTKDYPNKGVKSSNISTHQHKTTANNKVNSSTTTSSPTSSTAEKQHNDIKGSLHQKQMGRDESSGGQSGRVTVALVSPMPARETFSAQQQQNGTTTSGTSNNTSVGVGNPGVVVMNGSVPTGINGNTTQVSTSESASTLSEVSENSGHSNTSNSSSSSVIYRPTSSEDDLDLKISNKNVSCVF